MQHLMRSSRRAGLLPLLLPLLTVLLGAATGSAAASSNETNTPLPRRQQGQCPSNWGSVASYLVGQFVDGNGDCTDTARSGIRLAFHDCFPGACDGSIILSDECRSRPENGRMTTICQMLGNLVGEFGVGAADLVQFSAALGIASCIGPSVAFHAGRPDVATANPAGQMPRQTDSADSIVAAFAAKGFSATELVALLGAHSAARNIHGVALDSTVSRCEASFYTETAAGTAPASLAEDVALARYGATAQTWAGFGHDPDSWLAAFVPAYHKMSVMGVDESSLVDCSDVIPAALGNSNSEKRMRRDVSTGQNTTSSASSATTPTLAPTAAGFRAGRSTHQFALCMTFLLGYLIGLL